MREPKLPNKVATYNKFCNYEKKRAAIQLREISKQKRDHSNRVRIRIHTDVMREVMPGNSASVTQNTEASATACGQICGMTW